MLAALSAAGAEYLVVGAHALAAHGLPRATGDLDLWVRPSRDNAERVWRALESFGAPLDELTLEDPSRPEVVFQIGVVPRRIDVLTSITGVSFEEAWESRAVGRARDLADIAELDGTDREEEKPGAEPPGEENPGEGSGGPGR